jgi:hypothetical protein
MKPLLRIMATIAMVTTTVLCPVSIANGLYGNNLVAMIVVGLVLANVIWWSWFVILKLCNMWDW